MSQIGPVTCSVQSMTNFLFDFSSIWNVIYLNMNERRKMSNFGFYFNQFHHICEFYFDLFSIVRLFKWKKRRKKTHTQFVALKSVRSIKIETKPAIHLCDTYQFSRMDQQLFLITNRLCCGRPHILYGGVVCSPQIYCSTRGCGFPLGNNKQCYCYLGIISKFVLLKKMQHWKLNSLNRSTRCLARNQSQLFSDIQVGEY